MKYLILIALLGFTNRIGGKDHYKVEEDLYTDHKELRVGYGRATKNENCVFKFDL